ncbi:MAG: calcium-binding protein, partial [Gemmatimonadota bacterium]|nr:calcium-binding protein [Gemmatimonadota bacterium]
MKERSENGVYGQELAMFGDFGLIRLQEDSPDTVVPQEIAVTDLVKNDAAYITGSPRQFWYSEGGWWVISAKSKANEGFVSGAFDSGGMSGGGIFDLDSNIVGVLSVGWGGPRGARQDLTDRQDPHGTDYNPTIYSDVAYNGSSNFFYLKKFVSEHSPASIHGSSVDHFGSDIIRYDDAIIEFGWHLSNGRNVGYIRKYNADGTLDHSFGQSGEVQIEHGTSNQTIKCIIQVDHELIVFGNYSRAGKSNIYMSKLLSDGTFDAAFGRNGTIFFESDANENLASVVLGPNNEYFLAGTRFDGTSNDAFVLKVSSNGRADTEFGDDGYWIGVSPESSEFVSDIGMSQDGTIFVLSTTDKNRNWDFEVTSLSDTGTTNADFGSSGSVIGDYENEQDIANKLIVTEDGVYIGGYTNYSADESPLILKYDLLGNPDVEFGKNGKLFVSMGFGGNNYLTDMQFDSQGNIVALLSGVNLIQANEGWGDTISGNYVPKILTVDSSGNIRIDDSFVLTDFQGIYANSFLVEEGDIHLLLNNQGTRGFTSLVRGIEADGNIVKGKLGIIGIDFEGTDETEEITGTELDDFLDGNLGLDRIFGLGGDDFIWTNHYADGGSGNDKIIGWVGDDTLIGGTGFDHLSGQGGNDRLYASPDGGELHGHDGTDIGIFPGNVENYYAWRIS